MKLSAAIRPDQIRVNIYDCDDPISKTMLNTHANFETLIAFLEDFNGEECEIEDIRALFEVNMKVAETQLQFEEGRFVIDDVEMSETMYNHVMNVKNERELNSLMNFARNASLIPDTFKDASGVVRDNPWAEQTRNSLFDFVSKYGYAITEDGCFLGLRSIRHDYKDCHTGTIDNSPGQSPTMERWECDHNPNNTCSNGFHIRNAGYGFGGSRIVVVKVNPADVVSLPKDYQSEKMRVCKYEVLFEIEDDDVLKDTYFSSEDKESLQNRGINIVNAFEEINFEDDFEDDYIESNYEEIEWLLRRLKSRKISKMLVVNQLKEMEGSSNPFEDPDFNTSLTVEDIIDWIEGELD